MSKRHSPEQIVRKTRQAVAAKLAKAIADRDGGVAFDAENLTMSEYLSRWLEGSVKNSVKVRTYEEYDARKRNYVDPYLVHLQYRFRVVSYSSGHENSDLCTFAFGKGA